MSSHDVYVTPTNPFSEIAKYLVAVEVSRQTDCDLEDAAAAVNKTLYPYSEINLWSLVSLTERAVDFVDDEKYQKKANYKTATNPSGSVQQCDRRAVHEGHEWQAEFGGYFNSYCPGIG